jgi:urease accessory protein
VMCVGLLGAAVRIGIIGHVGAQKILSQVQPTISCLAAAERLSLDDIHSFLPQADIASMRHEIATIRLFAN